MYIKIKPKQSNPLKLIYILILSIGLFSACKKEPNTSFYYWKTQYSISPYEQNYLDSLNVEKLYVRFFDVDIKNGNAVPIGNLIVHEKNKKQAIVPVVFITNETFKQLDKNEINSLSKNIQHQIETIYAQLTDKSMQEVQIDCDWTSSTKSNYFYFLNQLKIAIKPLQLSVTVRLHQIKDKEKTGIPPVNKGVLMYYATSNPLDFGDKNSILDNTLASNYIKNINEYKLPLDWALPIYSWAIVQNQVGEKRLINGIRNEDLTDTILYKKISKTLYLIKQDHYLKGNYLYEDYKIKVESITFKDLELAKENYSKKNKNKELNTIFFQLDSSNLCHYSIQNLKTISL